MSKPDGGPAFPCHGKIGEVRGMTLRDYFAAKAMQAIRSKSMLISPSEVAKRAYEQADAMLAEREK